jgi:hypothetical protein
MSEFIDRFRQHSGVYLARAVAVVGLGFGAASAALGYGNYEDAQVNIEAVHQIDQGGIAPAGSVVSEDARQYHLEAARDHYDLAYTHWVIGGIASSTLLVMAYVRGVRLPNEEAGYSVSKTAAIEYLDTAGLVSMPDENKNAEFYGADGKDLTFDDDYVGIAEQAEKYLARLRK